MSFNTSSPHIHTFKTEAMTSPGANPPRHGSDGRQSKSADHTWFATWFTLNIVSWLILRTLGTGQVTIDEDLAVFVGIIATCAFFSTIACVVIMASDVWPRTWDSRLLGGILGFGVAACPAMVGDSWINGFHRFSFMTAGVYVGFVVESFTGLLGKMTEGLAIIGEVPVSSDRFRL